MKKTLITIILLIVTTAVVILSCKKKSSTTTPAPTSTSTSTPAPCATSGTSVNIGSTAGGTYFLTLGSGLTGGGGLCNGGGNCPANHEDRIEFNNTNLNFSMQNGCTLCGYTGCAILDAGSQSCLDFSNSGTPTAQIVAYTNGHGYIGNFGDGHVVKFIAQSYNQGIVKIAYIFQ